MKTDIDLGGGFVAEQTVNKLAEEDDEYREGSHSQSSHGMEYYYYRAKRYVCLYYSLIMFYKI